MSDPRDVTPAQFETAAKLLKEICASEDDAFMVGLLEAIVQKDPAGYTSKHNYKISNPTDWKAVKAMGTPGPHFSLRLAGGAYRFANNGLGLSELFVNSSTGTIHVDGEPVRNLQVHQGEVTFTTKDGKNFKIQFQCAQLPGDERSDPLFKGDTWSDDNEASKTTIMGTKFHPWGNSNEKDMTDQTGRLLEEIPPPGPGISEAKMLAAATVRVDAAMDSISVCLDLIRGHHDPLFERVMVMDVSLGSGGVSIPVDVYLGGFGLLICTAAAGVGGYLREKDEAHKWESAGGMAFAAGAAYLVATIVALTRYKCINRPSSEMRSFIKQYGAKGEPGEDEHLLQTWDLIEKIVTEEVDRLSTDDLKDEPKTHFESIRKSIGNEYRKKVRGDVGLTAYRKFRTLRHLAREEYDKAFDEETSAKFDADVSKGLLEKLMERKIKKRKAEVESKTLGDQIIELNRQRNAKTIARDKEIDEMKQHVSGKEEQKKEEERIKEKYAEELQPIEDELREKGEAQEKAEKDKLVDVEGPLKDIKREIERSRQSEKDAQGKSHTRGK
ncbi:hypothetical protein BDV35DRAFT_387879 [Aspergillus flavus]|uniref:Uncharacterized protein n=2 Tax=Aspergillus subgen. Circumdati TaxID=2720871 RepID=A0A1S9DQ78_ASPOZ|nr:hypothetical protein BDV35DRAFT_387879 [Aspergillus flavus]OOO11134.1 hypothetical protein OAory_01076040 [Aspergillus oryzae]